MCTVPRLPSFLCLGLLVVVLAGSAPGFGSPGSPCEAAGCTAPTSHEIRQGNGLLTPENWVVEQMPGGTTNFQEGKLVIVDKGGCTVWLRKPLQAPVRIRFKARLVSAGGPLDRVSDLNCFWMAEDPASPDGAVHDGKARRSGTFASYDALRCYYVGMGGNTNTTTRFRRYAGNGERPLLPEHDLQKPEFLLEPNKEYQIEIESGREGIRYRRDGRIFFEWKDPAPLTAGHFGFRTVWSHLEIRDFEASPIE